MLTFRNFKVSAKMKARDSITGNRVYQHSTAYVGANKTQAEALAEAKDALSHYQSDPNVDYIVVEKVAKVSDENEDGTAGTVTGLHIEKVMWFRKNGTFNYRQMDPQDVTFKVEDNSNAVEENSLA